MDECVTHILNYVQKSGCKDVYKRQVLQQLSQTFRRRLMMVLL